MHATLVASKRPNAVVTNPVVKGATQQGLSAFIRTGSEQERPSRVTHLSEIILCFTDLISRQSAELMSRNEVYELFLRDLQLHVDHQLAMQIEKVLGGVQIPWNIKHSLGRQLIRSRFQSLYLKSRRLLYQAMAKQWKTTRHDQPIILLRTSIVM